MPSPIASGPPRRLGLVASSVAARNSAAQADAERTAQLPLRPIANVAPARPRQRAAPQIQPTDPKAQAQDVAALRAELKTCEDTLALLQRQAQRRAVKSQEVNAQIESIEARKLVLHAFLKGESAATDQQGLPMTRDAASSEIAKLDREERLAMQTKKDLDDDELEYADNQPAFVTVIAQLESRIAAAKTVVTIANQRRS